MKLGIIIPWFGRELKGGAEQQAWQVATRLAGRGHHVEVLTTCCGSHQDDWETNNLPEGLAMEREGFAVRRFPVAPRDRAAFDRVCGSLLSLDPATLKPGVPPVSAEDSTLFVNELIKSPALLDYLKAHGDDFTSFILLPYLYGPVLKAIEIVGAKAALQPCLHDESYAYLPEVAQAFYGANRLLFNSEGERELALRLYGPGIWSKSFLVGEGVEVDRSIAASNGAAPLTEQGRFLLYLGRKDPGKNTPLLLRAFQRFRAVRPNSNLRLILAGIGSVDLNGADAIEDLGLVSEEQKSELLRDCAALVQPSENESFSRVMMEAWLHGKPVAVHSGCLATAVALRTADGGWSAGPESEWAGLFAEIERSRAPELARLGENGRRYAEVVADWDCVMDRYERALEHPVDSSLTVWSRKENARLEINQFLPNLSYGDAISDHARWIRDHLRGLGYRARIFVRFVDPRVDDQCEVFSPEAARSSNAIIYHHSIGTEITPEMIKYGGPKCLIYHNITPAEFFEPYRPEFADILRTGRDDLHNLAREFPLSFGDSTHNKKELEHSGFASPGVLPICVDPSAWAFPPDPQLMDQLQDGRTNLLFVGRISPNKKQQDLVYALRDYLGLDPMARLILVGTAEPGDPYVAHVQDTISLLGLGESVTLTGSVTGPQLEAYYRTAHLFWSMSEHEGFGVPLIEAMWFDVPVLAFHSTAIPETLGDAAMMFNDKNDWQEAAALAYLLVSDDKLRAKMIAAQRRQRESFTPEKIAPLVTAIAHGLQRGGTRPRRVKADGSPVEINQLLPNLSLGDAISNHALVIRDSLRAFGVRSKILVRYRDHDLAAECEVFSREALESSPAIIYHHSTGSDIASYILNFQGAKALIYHNITPPHFYQPYSPGFAERLRLGREELQRMAAHFPLSMGVSRYNAAELTQLGFRDPNVLPLAVDPFKLAVSPDPHLMALLRDGRTNLLFVGRIAPNKKQDDLLLAFAAYRTLDPRARLILVGDREANLSYSAYLDKIISEHGLQEDVLLPGIVSGAQLSAYYASADLFWSMSEHEGFCVPLIEAMWFDVPVLAFRSTAVPETLGDAGVIFSEKQDMPAVAAIAQSLVVDDAERTKIIDAQQRRRLDYLPEKLAPHLEQLALQLCSSMA